MQIFDSARKQLSANQSNVIVIYFNQFLGSIKEAQKIIAKQFLGGKNSRISGVLLFETFIDNYKLNYRTAFIHNIYAKCSVSNEFAIKIALMGRKENLDD